MGNIGKLKKYYRTPEADELDWGYNDDAEYIMENNYGIEFLGWMTAKDDYFDSLANNGLEWVAIGKDESGNTSLYLVSGDRVYDIEDEVLEIVEGDEDLKGVHNIFSNVDLADIPDEYKHGNCFVVALQEFMKNPDKYTLVHGVVNGQGPLEGIQYCHAWVIDNSADKVIDKTQPPGNQEFSVDMYYYIGQIEITREYDAEEVYRMVDKYETYGPWDPVFDKYD